HHVQLFFLRIRPPPTSTLFPYTTLFRSAEQHDAEEGRFEKESGEDLVGQQRPGDVADRFHIARPVGAELEAHGDARHDAHGERQDRKSTRLNSSHSQISYAVFCLKKKKN